MEIVEKQCVKCETKRCIDKFRQYPNNSYSTTCKKCLNEMDKLRKKNQRQKRLNNCVTICEKCNTEKKLYNFAKLKKKL